MSSVRQAIQRGVSAVAEREKPPETTKYDYSYLHMLKRAFEKNFREDPEETVAYIRKRYAFDVVEGSWKREFVSDWLAEHGFSDADAKEMRRRIDQHAAEAK